ncbi:MAG TPA: DUF2273 domain-containing protein [Spirochaetota bacterium]|nr:DUF2273 domain-containing protein [Spirochaetota bacterium]HNT10570.1 DUF2273 domain-containing protein [Spirochaetota bacterium]HNV47617.1 DUF2273 domain-containing protein [Spirochaetota bacterium]HPU89391.1 DUF2273 domain-containing protein [Spirochaetota bacterium]
MDLRAFIGGWINENPGKALGAAAGLLAGVLLFTLGILKTIVIALLIVTGYVIGKAKDDNVSVVDVVTGFFRRGRNDGDL